MNIFLLFLVAGVIKENFCFTKLPKGDFGEKPDFLKPMEDLVVLNAVAAVEARGFLGILLNFSSVA
jgi:hypothetical protein